MKQFIWSTWVWKLKFSVKQFENCENWIDKSENEAIQSKYWRIIKLIIKAFVCAFWSRKLKVNIGVGYQVCFVEVQL